MANILASVTIAKASIILQDTSNVRWTPAELLGWYNDGMREVVLQKPEASVTNASVALTASKCKQSLTTLVPAAIMLIDVVRNTGSAGTSEGSAIRLVSREIMDAQNPAWGATAASTTITHYMFDTRDPKTFYVYPAPSGATVYVELITAVTPTDIAANASCTLDDIYVNPIMNYIIYRAYSKDAEYAQNPALAQAYYQTFMMQLQNKSAIELSHNPNQTDLGASRNVASPTA